MLVDFEGLARDLIPARRVLQTFDDGIRLYSRASGEDASTLAGKRTGPLDQRKHHGDPTNILHSVALSGQKGRASHTSQSRPRVRRQQTVSINSHRSGHNLNCRPTGSRAVSLHALGSPACSASWGPPGPGSRIQNASGISPTDFPNAARIPRGRSKGSFTFPQATFPTLWVTVPPRIGGLKKFPIQCRNSTRLETESSTQMETQSSPQSSTQSSPSYIPYPNPIPSSSPGWPEAEAAVGKNLNEADRAIADCRKHGLEPSDVLALVEWWKANAGHFRKPSGALDYALRHAKPSQRSDWSQAFPTIAERPGRHPAELKPSDQPDREILKTVRQLELKFPDLKDMTGDEIAERYELPEALRKRLAGDLKWRYVRSDALKLDVLKYLDQFELAERN